MTNFISDVSQTTEAVNWNELFSRPGFAPRYPSEAVIRWCFRSFPRSTASQTRLLDMGCGTGRHAQFFAREGYQTTAVDFSPVAIKQLFATAEQNRLNIDGHVAVANNLPFSDNTFDGVLAFGILYYLPPEAMRKAISELNRVLKPGGRAFIMIKSNRDSRATFAERMNGCQYHLISTGEEITWPSEIGMTLTLLDRRNVRSYFSCFERISIDRSTVTHLGGRLRDDEWLVFVERSKVD